MKSSLYVKFLLTYVIFGILSFLLIATFSSNQTLRYLKTEKVDALYEEANYISSNYVNQYYSGRQTQSSLESLHTRLRAVGIYLSSEIWLVDMDGNILLNTANSSVDLENPVPIPDFDPADMGNSYYMEGRFYSMFEEDMLSVMSPITYNFRVKSYILIHTPLSGLVEQRDELLNITYITLLIIWVLSLLILLAFTFLVYYPLRKITLAAREYAGGNLEYELSLSSEDEMGQLAGTLNYMAHQIHDMEDYQKKFIANISHDFRSPLTSIKGYVEAILDGTIPPELYEKYLNIVLFETDRLNKLTSGLLTLNSFDIKQNMLDITEFDINSVIKNTAAAFEGTCTAKRISIELLFASWQLYVAADMGKIQQVLYNLIDNAIKFSNNDSVIYVETTVKHEKVFVSVKDSGIGIPRDSIKKIWERFYKSDSSRGKDKKGTGLGLSIVKEIIQSHGENINVISTEGVGTEFIFTLKKVGELDEGM